MILYDGLEVRSVSLFPPARRSNPTYTKSSYPLSLHQWDRLTPLIYNFSATNVDPNANILPTYDVFAGVQILTVLVFYNGPTPPAGLFDPLLAVPALSTNLKTRPFTDLVSASPSNVTAGLRCVDPHLKDSSTTMDS